MFKFSAHFVCAIAITVSLLAPASQADDLCGSMGEYGASGSGLGQFHGPKGFVYLGGLIYVVDSGNNRVQRILFTGPYYESAEVSAWGSFGQGDGQFNNPSGIAWDPGTGNLFVADTGNHRIQKFNMEGVFLETWGEFGTGEGQFDSPSFVAAGDGYVIVSDTGNKRVQVFSADGSFLRIIGEAGSGEGQFESPSGLHYEGFGSFLVADSELNVVQGFTLGGELRYRSTPRPAPSHMMGITADFCADTGRNQLCSWGGADYCWDYWAESEAGPLDSPFDVSFDCCYVGAATDTGNDRIVFFWCADPVQRISWGALKTRYE